MGFLAISKTSEPDEMRNSSHPASQMVVTHIESNFINQPSKLSKNSDFLKFIYFLRKSSSGIYNIFLNVQERTKGLEKGVAFCDI